MWKLLLFIDLTRDGGATHDVVNEAGRSICGNESASADRIRETRPELFFVLSVGKFVFYAP